MIQRKVFLKYLAGGGIALVLAGCGGGSDHEDGGASGGSGSSCDGFGISGNHGHALRIPEADLDAMSDRQYSIQGSASHDHTVTLSAAQLAMLKAGGEVMVTSSVTLDHSHDISGGCG